VAAENAAMGDQGVEDGNVDEERGRQRRRVLATTWYEAEPVLRKRAKKASARSGRRALQQHSTTTE
jgi:hypothetical protein